MRPDMTVLEIYKNHREVYRQIHEMGREFERAERNREVRESLKTGSWCNRTDLDDVCFAP